MKEIEEKQMTEIYAEIDAERLAKENELSQYRTEHNAITILLDSYSIPKIKDNVYLTLPKRLELALKMRGVA